jgi:hypothetical protein
MSAFSDTQGLSTGGSVEPPRRRDGFWAQTPAAVLTIAAVAAIVFVNGPERHAPVASTVSSGPARSPTASAPASTVALGAEATPATPSTATVPADCADCAVVLSVQQLQGTGDSGFAVEVRMRDGTRRTVRQFAAGFDVGDVVLVNGNALTLRPARP